ncbi:MAG: YqaE/Pmp3 family membrane protein [Pseudomonadota bacterium]
MSTALASRRDPATIAAALLLPPLGVWRARGAGRDFTIACVLTALGFLPGVAFALHQVLLSQR